MGSCEDKKDSNSQAPVSKAAAPKSESPPATKPLVVGFSQIGAESGWRTANSRSIKEEAEKRGVTLKFSDAQEDQEKQVGALRSFIQQRVDVIAMSPKTEDGWQEVLEEAKKAGIPVILTDRVVKVDDPSLYVTFIGADFVEEGRRAAEWLAKKTDGKAIIAELQGTPGARRRLTARRGLRRGLRSTRG